MMHLSTAYLGNIHYYTKLLSGEACLERWEHYPKQSYRNRCEVMTSNGVISLVVPVLRPSGERVLTSEVRIDYSKKWQHQHRQALISAYRSSPYFEHYESLFVPHYTTRYERLWELNEALQSTLLRALGVEARVCYSESYRTREELESIGELDLRDSISPKASRSVVDPSFVAPRYYQVFSEKHPFAENLSVVDLLFCEGPNSLSLLREAMGL